MLTQGPAADHKCNLINASFLTLPHLLDCLRFTSAEKLLCLLCKIILKISYLMIILWISLKKGERFDLNHSLGSVYPYSIHH